MSALSDLGARLTEELDSTVQYFGEDPQQMKAEELFNLIAQFSSSLLVSHFRAWSPDHVESLKFFDAL